MISGRLKTLGVPVRVFEEQIGTLLRQGYALRSLSESLEMKRVNPQARVVALTFDDAYVDFLTAALPVLQKVGASATLYVPVASVGEQASWLGKRSETVPRLLTWGGLQEVAQHDIEIGSHGWVHRPLDVLPRSSVLEDLRRSKSEIENNLGCSVRSFCYPHGYSTPAVARLVESAGYTNACIIGRRAYIPEKDDPFRIPRYMPDALLDASRVPGFVEGIQGPVRTFVKARLDVPWRLVRRTALSNFGVTLS